MTDWSYHHSRKNTYGRDSRAKTRSADRLYRRDWLTKEERISSSQLCMIRSRYIVIERLLQNCAGGEIQASCAANYLNVFIKQLFNYNRQTWDTDKCYWIIGRRNHQADVNGTMELVPCTSLSNDRGVDRVPIQARFDKNESVNVVMNDGLNI